MRFLGFVVAALLLTPGLAMAQATTAPAGAAAPAPSLAETVPMPRLLVQEISTYRIAAISVGAVAGVVAANVLTGGFITPLVTAGMAEVAPAAAAAGAAATAAAATGGSAALEIVQQTVVTAASAVVGGYIGDWLYGE